MSQLSFPGLAPALLAQEPRDFKGRLDLWGLRLQAVRRAFEFCAAQIWASPTPIHFWVVRDETVWSHDFLIRFRPAKPIDPLPEILHAQCLRSIAAPESFKVNLLEVLWDALYKWSKEPEVKDIAKLISVKLPTIERFVEEARSEEIRALCDLELVTGGAL